MFVVGMNHILPFALSLSVNSHSQTSYFLFELYVFSVVSERKEHKHVHQLIL